MSKTSDPRAVVRLVERLKSEVEREVNDRLPRKVGVIAVQHFRQNFRDSGFRDGGLRPWQKSKRELMGGNGASARYKTLTSARNHLMQSTQAVPARGEVAIENPVPYASIHNEGGTINSNPSITPQMRSFAWAMYYRAIGRKRGRKSGRKRGQRGRITPTNPEAEKWKGLALTKKRRLHIRLEMPKRQFIGDSRELKQTIDREIQQAIERIHHGTSTI